MAERVLARFRLSPIEEAPPRVIGKVRVFVLFVSSDSTTVLLESALIVTVLLETLDVDE